MDKEKNNDFWGITLFPELSDASSLSHDSISEHIQSYFMVFKNQVFTSKRFKEFWDSLKENVELMDVVRNCEIKLTSFLSEEGFTYSAYVKESKLLCEILDNHAIPSYSYPAELLICGCPIVKKKCFAHMGEEQKTLLTHFNSNCSLGGE